MGTHWNELVSHPARVQAALLGGPALGHSPAHGLVQPLLGHGGDPSSVMAAVLCGWACYWPLGWSCSWSAWWVVLGLAYFAASGFLFAAAFFWGGHGEPS